MCVKEDKRVHLRTAILLIPDDFLADPPVGWSVVRPSVRPLRPQKARHDSIGFSCGAASSFH